MEKGAFGTAEDKFLSTEIKVQSISLRKKDNISYKLYTLQETTCTEKEIIPRGQNSMTANPISL